MELATTLATIVAAVALVVNAYALWYISRCVDRMTKRPSELDEELELPDDVESPTHRGPLPWEQAIISAKKRAEDEEEELTAPTILTDEHESRLEENR